MEVKIGVQHANRELSLETNDEGDQIEAAVSKALNDGDAVFTLVDNKGRRIIVPVSKVAYVEIAESVTRKVGFTVS